MHCIKIISQNILGWHHDWVFLEVTGWPFHVGPSAILTKDTPQPSEPSGKPPSSRDLNEDLQQRRLRPTKTKPVRVFKQAHGAFVEANQSSRGWPVHCVQSSTALIRFGFVSPPTPRPPTKRGADRILLCFGD